MNTIDGAGAEVTENILYIFGDNFGLPEQKGVNISIGKYAWQRLDLH